LYHLLAEDLDFAENHQTQRVLAVITAASLALYAWRSVWPWFKRK
jgi:hypothetical protein